MTFRERLDRLLGATRRGLRALDPGAPRWLYLPVLILVAILVIWQVRSLGVPILGEHNWRQSDTYSVAWNFVHESPDFFHPRIDWTRGRSGVMGMEAPFFSYAIAAGMAVFGDDPAIGRIVAWILAMTALGLFARSLRPEGRRSVAVGLVVMAFFSPMVLFEFRQIQPDVAMVALMIMAAVCFHEYSKHERRRSFVLGMVAYTLAVLIKSPALVAGPAMWLFTFTAQPVAFRTTLRRAAWFAVPLALWWAWNQWAHHLNESQNGGEVYFAIEFNLQTMLADATNGGQLRHIFAFLLPSYICNWVLFPAFLAGVALGFEKENRPVALPMAVWFLGAALFLAAFSSRLGSHWYYALVILPPVLYFGALALGRVFDLATSREDSPARFATGEATPLSRWAAGFVVATLFVAPFVGGRLRELSEAPAASGLQPGSSWVGEAGFLGLAVIEMLALALAFLPAPRWGRLAYLPLLFVAGWLGLGRAEHDVSELFKWRTRFAEWETIQPETDALRAEVARFSTRDDLFLTDGGNPWYLYLPLRKGWTEDTPVIERNGLQPYTDKGARFFLHFFENGRMPRPMKNLKPIAHAPKWELYCLSPSGCPELPATVTRS
ncbi:MAG: glycosyltransferase family 39 protein [Myxococcota bacterium]